MGLFRRKKIGSKIGKRNNNSDNKKVSKRMIWCMHYWEFKSGNIIRSTFNRDLYEKIIQIRYEM